MRAVVTFFKPGAPMFAIGASLLAMMGLAQAFDLPSPAQLLDLLRPLYQHYGLPFVGLAYFIEGLFIINFYWPGSFIIFLAVALSDKSPHTLIVLWLVLNLAAAAALAVNVLIGRHGMYRLLLRIWSVDHFNRLSSWTSRRGPPALLAIGFHINWLAMGVVALAALRRHHPLVLLAYALSSHLLWTVPALMILTKLDAVQPGGQADNLLVVGAFMLLGVLISFVVHYKSRLKLA